MSDSRPQEPVDELARPPGPSDWREPVDTARQARDRVVDDAGGIGPLVADLIADLQGIVRGEVQLARAELRQDAADMGRAAGMIAGGTILGLVGLTLLMTAAALVLAQETDLDAWAAFGIVSIAVLALAAILALVGKNRLSAANLKPEQTIESLKEDRAWARDQISSVRQ